VNTRHYFRPRTARSVAGRASTLEQFGKNVRDWFHELRQLTTRDGLAAAVSHRPPRLRAKFRGGQIADAFLAAQVEYLCRRSGIRQPKWTFSPEYVLDEPWFGYSDAPAGLRAILIRDAPPEFKNRNLFTTSEIEWKPKRGRPRKSLEEHREKTRLRLRRWRKVNAAALKARRSKLKEILAAGSGVPAGQLDKAYDPKSLAAYRSAIDRASLGRRRSHR
jgi:hypothetical protein